MIQLDFLAAADGTPLTKQFEKLPFGGYDISPYPFIRNFTSHRVEVDTIEDFYAALVAHAELGCCLLKGELSEQLEAAPRQGMTNPASTTQWLCLDNDFSGGYEDIDVYLASIGPEFANVSYIFQHSASAGIRSEAGMRGHIFLMLETPLLPSTIKQWLRSLNLKMPALSERIELSSNGLSLKWPLDITTCQNDKLLYIAPPVCRGFEDPLAGRRFTLVKKARDRLGPISSMQTMTPAVTDKEADIKLAALREAAGLPAIRPRYREIKGSKIEYLSNPDAAVVTGVKAQRGFVYLNLNSGDSWAYYFPEESPEFLYNFKGEPIVRLKDIAPDFYREFCAQSQRKVRANRDFEPIVFRDRARDTYYTALLHADGRVDYWPASNTQKLAHFMLQYGETPPDVIEDWTVEFDPTTLKTIDREARWLNTFKPTEYIVNAKARADAMCPMAIAKVLLSICGDDRNVYAHLIHWLAYIFQTRKKAYTAYIFHGVSGTGKGILVSKILKPLLGASHVVEYTSTQIEDNFNAPLEQAIICWIDEFHHESTRSSGASMNKLKNMITEDRIAIRAMRREAVMVRNFLSLAIATNHPDPVQLAATDRRFNVPPAQEKPLVLTQAEIRSIDLELQNFADFLQSQDVSEQTARTIITTEARQSMIAACQTSVDRLFESLRNGDLAFFIEFVDVQMPSNDVITYSAFDATIKQWVEDAASGEQSFVSLSDIRSVYHFVIGAPIAPAKIQRMLKLHRIPYEKTRGTPVLWAAAPEDIKAYDARKAARIAAQQPNKLKVISNDQVPSAAESAGVVECVN